MPSRKFACDHLYYMREKFCHGEIYINNKKTILYTKYIMYCGTGTALQKKYYYYTYIRKKNTAPLLKQIKEGEKCVFVKDKKTSPPILVYLF